MTNYLAKFIATMQRSTTPLIHNFTPSPLRGEGWGGGECINKQFTHFVKGGRRLAAGGFAALLLTSPVHAATTTLIPSADAYVQLNNATTNYGANPELRVQTNTSIGGTYFASYLKFDTNVASGQIIGAKLRLYVALSAAGSMSGSAYAVSNTSWDEMSVTWNNKPALGAVLGSMSVTSTTYAWQEIDVTAYVQSERAAGRNPITLGLHAAAPSSIHLRANSREASSNPPQLVIVTNAAPTVSLLAPAATDSFTAPATLSIIANATDSDGSIQRVEFYNGSDLLGTDLQSPYLFDWLNVAAGTYTLTAKAFDNANASSTSAPVTVTVNAPQVVSGIYYIFADHLNTPRVITDQTNKTVWRWESDAFGTSAPFEDPDGDGIKFTYNNRFPGQYFDKETGLHYNYFRDYDPSTGRYVQSDPIGLGGGLNTFGYANQNPISNIDPLGLFTSSTHNEITTAAIAIAGSTCPNLPAAVAMADWLPGSQAPQNAHWHAMRDGTNPKSTPASAKNDFNNFVNEQWKSCTCEGLARALHALQDSYARGHAGHQPWGGGLPSPRHVYNDGYPSRSERAAAVNATVNLMRTYAQGCKNQCPK